MRRAKGVIALIAAVIITATLLPTGVSMAAAPTPQPGPLSTDRVQFTVGGTDSNVTQVPAMSAEWPTQPPADIATQYVWSGMQFQIYTTTNLNYYEAYMFISDHWVDHQPHRGDPEVKEITTWGSAPDKLSIATAQYVYFLYNTDPYALPSWCYAAKLEPISVELSAIELATPEVQPADGFPLSTTVALKPVWTVGTVDKDVFTAVPELLGCYPDGTSVQWGLEGAAADAKVVTEEGNVTRGDNVGVLVPPAQGRECTYTGQITSAPGTMAINSALHKTPEPATLKVLWTADSEPAPTQSAAPEPEPSESAGPEPTVPSGPENGVPYDISNVLFNVGGPDSNVTEVSSVAANWPTEPPADIAAQYVWSGLQFHIDVESNLNYYQRHLFISDHWVDHQPDQWDSEVTAITQSMTDGGKLSLTKTNYLYFMYNNDPYALPYRCYVAKLEPVTATVSAIELVSPETMPADGCPGNVPVVVRPVWSVGTLNDSNDFVVIPDLYGCPQNAAVKWGIKDLDGDGPAIQGGSDISQRDDDVTLVPMAPGGECTYTATVAAPNGNSLYALRESPSITVNWITQSVADEPPIQSRPDALFTVSLQPNLDGTGHILTGIPIGTQRDGALKVQELLSQIEVPAGASAVVRNSDGTELGADAGLGTGCEVEVSGADGAVLAAVPIVIRGDVLGTGVLDLAQITRLASAYLQTHPLSGPYKDAALLLADSQNVSLASLVELARMLRSANVTAR